MTRRQLSIELDDHRQGPARTTTTTAVELHPERHRCPTCTGRLRRVTHEQAALFWLHGYGFTTRTTSYRCACGYWRHARTDTISPR